MPRAERATARGRRGLLTALALGVGPAVARGPVTDEHPATPALSPAQRAWLAAHQPIRWLPELDYAPFVAVGADGVARGLSVEILSRIAQALGLPLAQRPPGPLREQLLLMQRRQGDLVTSLRATPERSAYLLFTRPYVSVPTVLVARRRPGTSAGPGALAAMGGQAVAVGSGYAVEATVRAAYPAVHWHGVPSDQAGLDGVATGRFAAVVVDAASGGHLMAQPHLQALQVVADVGFRYDLSFAVRSDWPVLRDILDMGIAGLPRADLAALRRQWLTVLPDRGAPQRAPLATGLGLALLAAGGLGAAAVLWRRRAEPAAGDRGPGGRGPGDGG